GSGCRATTRRLSLVASRKGKRDEKNGNEDQTAHVEFDPKRAEQELSPRERPLTSKSRLCAFVRRNMTATEVHAARREVRENQLKSHVTEIPAINVTIEPRKRRELTEFPIWAERLRCLIDHRIAIRL